MIRIIALYAKSIWLRFRLKIIRNRIHHVAGDLYMEDIHKVIAGLKSCTGSAGHDCNTDCPYYADPEGCREHMERDALEILRIAAAEE